MKLISSMKYIYTFLLFFILSVPVSSENEDVGSLTMEDGLSSNSVKTIYKDSKGYIYFGTSIGVDRFDGTNIVCIPFPDVDNNKRWVSSIIESNDGKIYVGNDIGLWLLDKHKLTLKRVFGDMLNAAVTCMEKSNDGTIYVGTLWGLYSLKDDALKKERMFASVKLKDQKITDMACDRGRLWIITRKGLLLLNMKSGRGGAFFDCYPIADERTFTKIAAAPGYGVYIGTNGDGILKFDERRHCFSRYSLDKRSIADLSYDRRGHLLAATSIDGAFEIAAGSGEITHRYVCNGSPGDIKIRYNTPWVFYRDNMGVNWFGYVFFGVDYTYYTRELFHTYAFGNAFTTKNLPIRSFLIDGKVKLIGSRQGLYVVNETRNAVTHFGSDVMQSNVISRISKYGGMYFIGTIGGGLHVLDAATLSCKDVKNRNAIDNTNIYYMCDDNNGSLWLCTTKGLARYVKADNALKVYTSSNAQLLNDEVFFVKFDSSGRGWIATRGGLCILHPLKQNVSASDVPQCFDPKMMFRDIISCTDGSLLFMPQRGFPIKSNGDVTKVREIKFPINDNMPSISNIMERSDGDYIFATEDMLYMSSGKGSAIRGFSYIDGIPELSFQSLGVSCCGDIVWLATGKGLCYFNQKEVSHYKYRHIPIILSEIQTDHWLSQAEVSEVSYNNIVKLGRSNSDLSVKFSPMVYSVTKGLRYKYRLDGYDEEWHVANNDHTIYYHSLPVGHYVLYIKVVGMDEINAAVDVVVPLSNTSMLLIIVIFVTLLSIGYVIYCKHYDEEYFWIKLLPKQEDVKYQKSKISKDDGERMKDMLLKYMETEKPYLNPDLQMSDIAKAIGCSTHVLSQLFTQYIRKNYYDFIAEYRIGEFKRLASDPEYSKYTISALAEKSAFKSRTPFLKSFKKITGMTPKEYLKTVK